MEDKTGMLMDFDEVMTMPAQKRPPFPGLVMPGVNLVSSLSENNNPFDLVFQQTECHNDPFDSALMNALTFHPSNSNRPAELAVDQSHSIEQSKEPCNVQNSHSVSYPGEKSTKKQMSTSTTGEQILQYEDLSLLDMSNLSHLNDDTNATLERHGNVDGPHSFLTKITSVNPNPEGSTCLEINPPSLEMFEKTDEETVGLPALNSEEKASDLDLIKVVQNRVSKCIENALNRSRSISRPRETSVHDKMSSRLSSVENMPPNVPESLDHGSLLSRKIERSHSFSNQLADMFKASSATVYVQNLNRSNSVSCTKELSLASIKESLRRIRSSSVSLSGGDDGTKNISTGTPVSVPSVMNTGFLKDGSESLLSSNSMEHAVGISSQGSLKNNSDSIYSANGASHVANMGFLKSVSSGVSMASSTHSTSMASSTHSASHAINVGFLKSTSESVFSGWSATSASSVLNRGFLRSTLDCNFDGSMRSVGMMNSTGSDSVFGASPVPRADGNHRSLQRALLLRGFSSTQGDDSVFEEAIRLAHIFKESADNDLVDINSDSGDENEVDLRTSRGPWETSNVRLPTLDDDDDGCEDQETTPDRPGVRLPQVPEREKSLLRRSFEKIMSLKPGDPNRSLRRSLSSGCLPPGLVSADIVGTPVPLSLDNIRDLSLQPCLTGTPVGLGLHLQNDGTEKVATLRPKRGVAQASSKKGPMKAVLPVGNMVRKKDSPPRVQKSPPKADRPLGSSPTPVTTSTPVRGTKTSVMAQPEMSVDTSRNMLRPQCTSTPRAKLSGEGPPSPGTSPIPRGAPVRPGEKARTVRSLSDGSVTYPASPAVSRAAPQRSVSASGEASDRPAVGVGERATSTPVRRNSTGRLKSLPSPIPNAAAVGHGQTPENQSMRSWNRGPLAARTTDPSDTISRRQTPSPSHNRPRSASTEGAKRTSPNVGPQKSSASFKLASLKGTICEVSNGQPSLENNAVKKKVSPKKASPEKTPAIKPSNGNSNTLKCIDHNNQSFAKPSTPKAVKLPDETSRLPVRANPKPVSRLENLMRMKFNRNRLPSEKENVRPLQ